MFTKPKNIVSEKEHGFTLIELIVVIIIVGILAAVGLTQYSKTVEKGRGAEAKTTIGTLRKLAYEYYLQNGTFTGLVDSDVNIGTSPDQVPGSNASACRSTHYFYYHTYVSAFNFLWIYADRCGSGGKTPQGTGTAPYHRIRLMEEVTGAAPIQTWDEFFY